MEKIKILFVAAELTPIAKVGGLADVIGALPKALAKHEADVRIVIPKYSTIDEKKYPLKKIAGPLAIPFKNTQETITIYKTPLPGSPIPIYLIDNLRYLGRGGVYFEQTDAPTDPNREADRFTFFSKSCLSLFEPLNWYPDVIHCHDWHVGLVPLLLKIQAKTDARLQKIKTVFSIHNLEYQGRFNAEEIMHLIGVTADDYPTLSILQEKNIISVQQGILVSDYISAVSPSYAAEVLTPEYGAGLENTLAQRRDKLVGILNGIDTDRFNPATDDDIAATFSSDDCSNKKICKADLQKTCGLTVDDKIPVLGIVSRLAEQKGLELITAIASQLVRASAQLIVLGTGQATIEAAMREIEKKYPNNIRCNIAFDAKFAQKIYAGSDMFLMPSKFEPCGLGQMIAMRYGTVPIVRATGGLKDTVTNVNPKTGSGDGFVFTKYNAKALLEATQRALHLYRTPKKWYNIIRRIMKKDFSWDNSAKKYIKLYNKIRA